VESAGLISLELIGELHHLSRLDSRTRASQEQFVPLMHASVQWSTYIQDITQVRGITKYTSSCWVWSSNYRSPPPSNSHKPHGSNEFNYARSVPTPLFSTFLSSLLLTLGLQHWTILLEPSSSLQRDYPQAGNFMIMCIPLTYGNKSS